MLLNYVDSTYPDKWTNYQIRSHDGGATWGAPQRVDLGQWEGELPGPGTGIMLRHSERYRGRIVTCGATGYQKFANGTRRTPWMPLFFSDDGGATYHSAERCGKPHPGTPAASAFYDLAECQVAELANGSVDDADLLAIEEVLVVLRQVATAVQGVGERQRIETNRR